MGAVESKDVTVKNKDITVIVQQKVYHCPLTWTVNEVEGRIRSLYVLKGGELTHNGFPVKGTEKISSFTGKLEFVGGSLGSNLIRIPTDRPWSLAQRCPVLGGGECPPDKLVDVDNAIIAAVELVASLKDEVTRVAPIVISRVYRGGKTTLIDLISKKLRDIEEYFVITISTNGGFYPRKDESWHQALVRLIAYQMVEPNPVTDRDNLFVCEEAHLLEHLEEINNKGKTVILLIDELNKLGVPLDGVTSAFLTKHFLDKKGRFLIFSSHVQFHIDSTNETPTASHMVATTSGRTMKTLPLPFCTDRDVLQRMLDGSVTDLKITLAVGIPSLLYVMSKPSTLEMTFKDRFDDVMKRCLQSMSTTELTFVRERKNELLEAFLNTIIFGGRQGGFFEGFSTLVDNQHMRFPLPYIPIILQFFKENDGVELYNALCASAETVETGRDWELVVVLSIYIRSLAAKYCRTADGHPFPAPFGIVADGVQVQDVKVITIPPEVTDVAQAVQHITESTQKARTIYIFQLAYSKFPDFDGFLSYGTLKRHVEQEEPSAPIIHGFQCKLTRGYIRHPVSQPITKGWFLRGGTTVKTPDRQGWTFPTEADIQTDLLGYGLSLLHPMQWGSVQHSDSSFD